MSVQSRSTVTKNPIAFAIQGPEHAESFPDKVDASTDEDPYIASRKQSSQHTKASRNEMTVTGLKSMKVDKIEASVDNDPYLSTSMHSVKQTEASKNEMNVGDVKVHKVDAIEASVDNDPYLSTTHTNQVFMHQVESSLDDDPYLPTSNMHNAKQTKATKNEVAGRELLKAKKVDNIEASIDNDPYLAP